MFSCLTQSFEKSLLIRSVCEKQHLGPLGPFSESFAIGKDLISRRFLSKSCASARFTCKVSQSHQTKSLPSLFACPEKLQIRVVISQFNNRPFSLTRCPATRAVFGYMQYKAFQRSVLQTAVGGQASYAQDILGSSCCNDI